MGAAALVVAFVDACFTAAGLLAVALLAAVLFTAALLAAGLLAAALVAAALVAAGLVAAALPATAAACGRRFFATGPDSKLAASSSLTSSLLGAARFRGDVTAMRVVPLALTSTVFAAAVFVFVLLARALCCCFASA